MSLVEFQRQLAIRDRHLHRGDGNSCHAQHQELFLLPALRNGRLGQPVVCEDGRGLRWRNAVGKLCEVAVAGVGERLFRGEGEVALRMGASQVPVPGSVADVQVTRQKTVVSGSTSC